MMFSSTVGCGSVCGRRACSARCRSIRSRIRSSKSLSRQVLIHHYRQSVTALARAQGCWASTIVAFPYCHPGPAARETS
jgi:hypothetical protein